jgi:hypothetical protein
MSNSVPSVSSAEIAVASGLLGAGIGYLAAPRKYNLEDLLTQKPDVFQKAVPKNLLVSESERNAYDMISFSRASLLDAIKSNSGDATLAELLKSKENIEAYKIIKDLIPKTRATTAAIVGVLSGIAVLIIRYLTSPNN